MTPSVFAFELAKCARACETSAPARHVYELAVNQVVEGLLNIFFCYCTKVGEFQSLDGERFAFIPSFSDLRKQAVRVISPLNLSSSIC